MGRFDRYLLSQLVTLFGFFSLVLVLIYWINQAVRLFDQIISDGQSAWVFLEITALTLPGVIKIVLPLSAFVAAVYVTNRMTAESEMTVVQATGYSSFRLARPVMYFGGFAMVLMLILMHVLVPASSSAFNERQAELNENITARFLTEGQFMTPTAGVTLYIRDIQNNGELLDIFLSDTRKPSESLTYTAARAYLVRTDKGPQLVMVEGMAQALKTMDQSLVVTTFKDFAYDIGSMLQATPSQKRKLGQIGTYELLTDPEGVIAETGSDRARLSLEIHQRNAQGLMAALGAILGFSALLVGGFSRFGVWRQILVAIGLVVLVRTLETLAIDANRTAPELWGLAYVHLIVGFAISWFLLFWSGRPYLFRRHPAKVSGALS